MKDGVTVAVGGVYRHLVKRHYVVVTAVSDDYIFTGDGSQYEPRKFKKYFRGTGKSRTRIRITFKK